MIIKSQDTSRDGLYVTSFFEKAAKDSMLSSSWLFDNFLDKARLEIAISKLLDYYPILSGRVTKSLDIALNNSGAIFSVFSYKKDRIDKIDRKAVLDGKYIDLLDLKKVLKGESPLFSITLSELKDGSVLNVQCSKLALDVNEFYRVINNLAAIYSSRDLIYKFESEFLDMDSISSDSSIIERYSDKLYKVDALDSLKAKLLGDKCRYAPPVFIPSSEFDKLGNNLHLGSKLTALAVDILKKMGLYKSEILYICIFKDLNGKRIPLLPITVSTNSTADECAKQLEVAKMANMDEVLQLYKALFESNKRYTIIPHSGCNRKRPTTIFVGSYLKTPIYTIDFNGLKPLFSWPPKTMENIQFFPAQDKDGVYLYIRLPQFGK